MDDSEIVDLFLNRDGDAVSFASRKYGARLRSIAFGIVRDAPTAEECENDAYLAAWELIPPNEPREYLFEFLARIVRNKALDRCRRDSAGKRSAEIVALTDELLECLPARDGAEQTLAAKALTSAINGFLKRQPREKSDMFLRRYWFCDSIGEIAERFGKSEGSVKTTLWRMRAKLRKQLESEGIEI